MLHKSMAIHKYIKRRKVLALAILTCFIYVIIFSNFPIDEIKSASDLSYLYLTDIIFKYKNIKPVMVKNNIEISNRKSAAPRTFKILFWPGLSEKLWIYSGTNPTFADCTYENCYWTGNRAELNSSDVVVMDLNRQMHHQLVMPAYKLVPRQMWIMKTGEPPIHDHIWYNFKKWDGVFNATWSYHREAEIFFDGYGMKVVRRDTELITQHDYAKGKMQLIAWFVSNCQWPRGTQSKRLQYVRNLQDHIQVDIVGPCGRKKCQNCDQMLKKDYKFYLAFENSICEDYITEKVWRPLQLNTVPIVLGGGDYTRDLPPNSYIDIKDFNTPKDLANYLYILDKNDTMYNSYFRWKAHYELKTSNVLQTCLLCEYINKYWNQSCVYENMGAFMSVENRCKAPEVFYEHVDKAAWTWQSAAKTFLETL